MTTEGEPASIGIEATQGSHHRLNAVFVYSIECFIKSYYTVRVTAQGLTPAERIALESCFAAELGLVTGAAAKATAVCLAVKSEGVDGSSRADLQRASEAATDSIRASQPVPEGCRFSIEAW